MVVLLVMVWLIWFCSFFLVCLEFIGVRVVCGFIGLLGINLVKCFFNFVKKLLYIFVVIIKCFDEV